MFTGVVEIQFEFFKSFISVLYPKPLTLLPVTHSATLREGVTGMTLLVEHVGVF